jgi:hypothetical protein
MLQKAAAVDVVLGPGNGSITATVTVTNRTGHKLPTGYPEGRRMWLNLLAYDSEGTKIFESGAYDSTTGVLTEDAQAVVYEAHLGLSPALGGAIGLAHGPSFHFALNDTLYKDNRIPPAGFTNAAFDAFGGKPVDSSRPAPRYADGQNWDVSTFAVPAATAKVVARLYYQTTSKEYVEFLRDENTTNDAGQVMFDAWTAHGKAPPKLMAADSATSTVDVPGGPVVGDTRLEIGGNPFLGPLELRLTLARPSQVHVRVLDARGRTVHSRDAGFLGGGANRVWWDGTDRNGRDAGPGVFWVVVRAGDVTLRRQVIRLR